MTNKVALDVYIDVLFHSVAFFSEEAGDFMTLGILNC